MRGSRSSLTAAGLLAAALAGPSAAAHRLDEYLQAARVAIDPGRVVLDLDLTPGVAVADAVLEVVDVDGDGAVSGAEGRAYLATVLEALTLDVDGRPLTLALERAAFPPPGTMRQGLGTARLRASASLPPLAAGPHRLHYRNGHRPEISVYLANALVPADDRVAITGQSRDAAQRSLQIDFTVRGRSNAPAAFWWITGAAALMAVGALAGRRWRRRPKGARAAGANAANARNRPTHRLAIGGDLWSCSPHRRPPASAPGG